MELVREHGTAVVVHEYWTMVDHSPLRNGAEWLPGPKRFALVSGEPVRRIDETTFQVLATGLILSKQVKAYAITTKSRLPSLPPG